MPVEINGEVFPNLNTASEVAALKTLAESEPYSSMTKMVDEQTVADNEKIAREVIRKSLVDPSPWPQIPDPAKFNVDYLLGVLMAQDDTALAKIPEDSLDRVGERIEQLDVAGVLRAATVWHAKGHITEAAKNALIAEATATVDDPNAAQVAGASPLGAVTGREPSGLTHLEVEKAKEVG